MTLIWNPEADTAELRFVEIKLKVEGCPPFLDELRKLAEEELKNEETRSDVGRDTLIIGGEGLKKFLLDLSSVGVAFQLVFDLSPFALDVFFHGDHPVVAGDQFAADQHQYHQGNSQNDKYDFQPA